MEQLGKVFLSHKSEDKNYVRYVAEKIGLDRCHYDEYTFEAGMKALDEILEALDSTDLFVLFISDKALNSPWVAKERKKARKLMIEKKLRQIYPIIIDPNPAITYEDKRIPEWMRNHYNIRKVLSPKIATQKIKARLRELTWEINPALKAEQTYFFGRNQEIEAFEQRRGNLDRPELVCCVASGFEGIGRKRYMDHCLKKANILRPSHSYCLLQMELHDSAEDFILKLSNLCVGHDNPKTVKALKSSAAKSDRITELLKFFQENQEVVFVDDSGTLITPTGAMVSWLSDALKNVDQRFVLGIASKYHLKASVCPPGVFQTHIGELSKTDRANMLREYSQQKGFDLDRDLLRVIADLLTGYPAQIFWAVALLEDYGEMDIEKHLNEVVDYSSDKAAAILNRFDGDEDAMDFLAYLSRFEILSADMLNKAFEINETLQNVYEQFRALSICNLYGGNGEMIRVSDVVRDYVSRLKRKLPKIYLDIIKEMVTTSVDDKFLEDSDLALYYAVIKQKILQGVSVDSMVVLPSLYIKSIVEFYNNRKYKRAYDLCKKLIEERADQDFTLELRRTLYVYLCQSLAREHKEEFFTYVNDPILSKVDRLYLKGFYYRINNKPKDAINMLNQALGLDGSRAQIRRELVNAYILAEDYESALKYSRINYDQDPLNPYHAQSYFRCIINSPNAQESQEELQRILDNIEKNKAPKAQQMYATMKAQYSADIEHDYLDAIGILDRAMVDADDAKVYLLMSKFDIAVKNGDLAIAEKAYQELDVEIQEHYYFKNALIIRHSRLMKLQKKPADAVSDELSKLINFPEAAMERLRQQLLQ